ncbi:MAG: DUF2589 domain-containing protein [Cellulosilyticaceae bacterium]
MKVKQIVTVEELIMSIQNAVIKANITSDRQYIDSISKYFTDKGEPFTKQIVLPTNGNDVTKLEVPWFSLVPFSGLKTKQVEMEFQTYIEGVDENNEILLNFKDVAAEYLPKINLKISFDSIETPEVIMKVNDTIISEYLK